MATSIEATKTIKPEITNKIREFDIIELSKDRFEAKIGKVHIAVETAKEPHKPWNPDLKNNVLSARKSYWELWGMVPLEDDLDELSYVDVAFITYRDAGSHRSKTVTEGLSMRTVLINGKEFDTHTRLPDDLLFWVGPDNIPLFDLLSEKLFQGNNEQAKDKIHVASRVAPLRPIGKTHNIYTPEAFAAIQVKAAIRAMEDDVQFFVNTMRPEMDKDILSLPNGIGYRHTRTEDLLGIDRESVKLDRTDDFVLYHIFNYLGYFTRTPDLVNLLKDMLETKELDPDTLITIGIDPEKIDFLKSTHLKHFIPLITQDGVITSNLTGKDFRRRIAKETGDGPASYTMTTQRRFIEGVRVLRASASAHDNKLDVAS